MLWMESYLFNCSVRLGVIVIAVLTFLQLLIPVIAMLALGVEFYEPFIELFRNDDIYKKSAFVTRAIDWVANHAQPTIAVMITWSCLHMICCILAIVGALKLQKWLLLPSIIMDFTRVIFYLATHIILMIILKKKLSLGVLIAVTLFGGFAILYLGYNWVTTVALFQIIELVHTKRYRQLYGDDPFRPQLPPNYGETREAYASGIIENVRVLVTPNTNEIDILKKKHHQQPITQNSKQPIIAVLPANLARMPLINRERQQRIRQQEQYQNDYNANWQWSELLIDGRRKQRNALNGKRW